MPASERLRETDPARIGPFELLGRLGEGGQGVVYLAQSADHGTVAVKRLRADLGADPDARTRFIRELETAKRVARFCTAAVLEADLDGDHPYIVSEYVDGPSLAHVVRTQGPRDGGALERLAVGTATALVAIHQAGVVHRDFKPQNVLLGPDGPRVIDFGIARALDARTITATGLGIGTPAYMTPEQLRGERTGPAADVFSWAATMAFASSGRPPFGEDALDAVAYRILHEAPDPGPLDGRLREVAARCLSKDPALRPPASEVLSALIGEPVAGATEALPPAVLEVMAEGEPTAPSGPPPSLSGPSLSGPSPPGSPPFGPPPAGPRRDRPERRGGPAVVAVSGAVIAVALAVAIAVTALALSDSGTAGDPPTAAASAPSERAGTGTTAAGGSRPGDPSGGTGTDSPPDRAGVPAALAGSWSGRARQNDGKVLTVRLGLPAGGRQGKITYPGQGCSGTLTLVGDPGATSVTLRERITAGKRSCVDTGTVTLTRRPGGTLKFHYISRTGGRTWTVTGTLTRG